MNLPGLPHSPLPAFIPASIPAFIPAFRPARLRGFIPPHLTSLLLAWLFALAGALAEPATAWDWPLASPHPIVAPYAAPATVQGGANVRGRVEIGNGLAAARRSMSFSCSASFGEVTRFRLG